MTSHPSRDALNSAMEDYALGKLELKDAIQLLRDETERLLQNLTDTNLEVAIECCTAGRIAWSEYYDRFISHQTMEPETINELKIALAAAAQAMSQVARPEHNSICEARLTLYSMSCNFRLEGVELLERGQQAEYDVKYDRHLEERYPLASRVRSSVLDPSREMAAI